MKLKLGENLSRHLRPALAALGHDVATAADEGLLGRSDLVVGEAATTEGRMLLTLDVQFANLRTHPPGRHPGICLFRPRSHGPLAVNRFVEAFVRTTVLDDLAGAVVVVEPARVRVRRPRVDGSQIPADANRRRLRHPGRARRRGRQLSLPRPATVGVE